MDAQPAQFESDDNLICLPESLFSFILIIISVIILFVKNNYQKSPSNFEGLFITFYGVVSCGITGVGIWVSVEFKSGNGNKNGESYGNNIV